MSLYIFLLKLLLDMCMRMSMCVSVYMAMGTTVSMCK